VNSGLNSTAAADQLQQHVHKNLDFGKIVPPRFRRWRSPALGNDGSWRQKRSITNVRLIEIKPHQSPAGARTAIIFLEKSLAKRASLKFKLEKRVTPCELNVRRLFYRQRPRIVILQDWVA
jgi:hypothetical protein